MTWTEPELNSVYTRRVHFSANEFKEVLSNLSKNPKNSFHVGLYSLR